MIESLQLRGMSERTQEAYVSAARQLAQHYKKSPDLVSEEELRQYFLYIKNVKKYSQPTTTIALCGIKFFIERTLRRQWTIFEWVSPPREKKLHPQCRRGSKDSVTGEALGGHPNPAIHDHLQTGHRE